MDNMSAYIVNNQEEINKIYFYADKENAPKTIKFPCVIIEEDHIISGISRYSYYIEYCPKGLDFRSWAVGKGAK